MEERLAYFEGSWTEEERRLVEETIAWKEKTTEFPLCKFGEPWVVIRQKVGERRFFLAHRHGWSRPVEASTPAALAAAIRDR